MIRIHFETRDGSRTIVETKSGLTLMEAAVAGGFDEILATCGGGCSCGTCHVQLHEDQYSRLPPPSQFEQEMLKCLPNMTDSSRLSCQVTLAQDNDGMVVFVPEQTEIL